jgi:hypothetical protein
LRALEHGFAATMKLQEGAKLSSKAFTSAEKPPASSGQGG